jgi:hypothetical protein
MGNTSKPWITSIFAPSIELLDNYKGYNKAAEKYQPLQASQIQEAITRACPSAITGVRESVTDMGKRVFQRRGIRLPSLNVARKDFGTYIGESLVWDDFEATTGSLVSEDTN